jgi:hypothetical protein
VFEGIRFLKSCLDILGWYSGLSINGYAQHSYISVKDKISQLTYKLKNGSDFNLTNRQHENIKLKIKVLKKAVGPGFPAIVEVMKVYDIQ